MDSDQNKFIVENHTVTRNGEFWGFIEETDDQFIVDGWMLDKISEYSENIIWTNLDGTMFTFTRIQPITIETLQGNWINTNNNRFKVEGISVTRNGVFWGTFEETEHNIIIRGWVLDKMSWSLKWRDSNGSIVKWARLQLTDYELLENRMAATEYGQRFILTEAECGNSDIISLVDFEDGVEILAIPHQNNASQYHCFLQETLLNWILEKHQRCIHPMTRAHVDINTIVIGRFQID